MKSITIVFFLWICVGFANASPEITGIFSVGGTTRFVLVDSETGESSSFLTTGQEFGGYRLVGYDQPSATLTLEKEGVSRVVGLKNAVIKEMQISLSGTIHFKSGEDTTVQKVILTLDQESAFPCGNGVTIYLKPKKRSDGNLEYASRWERVNPDGKKEVFAAPKVIARSGEAIGMFVDDVGFELKP